MTETTTMTPVTPAEISTPSLPPQSGVLVWSAVNLWQGGQPVFVSCTYPKQTKSKPRIAGVDYIPLPGVTVDAQMGPIVRVFRRKADNAVRITIWSLTRQEYTCIIPDGLTSFVMMPITEEMLRSMLPKPKAQTQQQAGA